MVCFFENEYFSSPERIVFVKSNFATRRSVNCIKKKKKKFTFKIIYNVWETPVLGNRIDLLGTCLRMFLFFHATRSNGFEIYGYANKCLIRPCNLLLSAIDLVPTRNWNSRAFSFVCSQRQILRKRGTKRDSYFRSLEQYCWCTFIRSEDGIRLTSIATFAVM